MGRRFIAPVVAAVGFACGVDQRIDVTDAATSGGQSGAVGNGGFPSTGGSAGGIAGAPSGGGSGGVSGEGGTAGGGTSGAGSGGAPCLPPAIPGMCTLTLPDCSTCTDGVCLRKCGTSNACKSAVIVCPPGLKCLVECTAQSACDGAKIDCGEASSCEVVCSGDHACKSAEITCGGGPCTLKCDGHDHACNEGTKFVCGQNACGLSCNGYDPPSTIECASAPCSGCPAC